MMRLVFPILVALLTTAAVAQDATQQPLPIIDMHLHALPAAAMGPPPLAFCVPTVQWPVWDQRREYAEIHLEWEKDPTAVDPYCTDPIWSAQTDEGVMERTLEILERRNIIGVTSGPLVHQYQAAAPDRIIPSLHFGLGNNPTPVDTLRAWFEEDRYLLLGEVTIQYEGIEPGDPRFAPYLALAEELDIPVGIHIGTGPPGSPYLGFSEYRARLHSPLLLEEALISHPRLRIYIAHAGWPMIDDLLALMWTHPQVHVDIGIISFALPPAGFHRYLRQIVEAGFGNRVMFGSDQMVWPEAIEVAIERIETADYLTDLQKRDILYNNAARFLRLGAEEIARHNGR